jgi:hypothetical protein
MPPRFAYWTILAGGLPTAFRAASREDLLPTYKRLREKHPDAELKWFARGTLWESPAAAKAALEAARLAAARTAAARGRQWRPGGEHRDTRQEYTDAKKERNQRERKTRWARKTRVEGAPEDPGARPHRTPERRAARRPAVKTPGAPGAGAARRHGPTATWKGGRRPAPPRKKPR